MLASMGMGINACSRCRKQRRLRRGLCRRCRVKEHGPDAVDTGSDVGEAVVESGALGALGRIIGALVRALVN